MTIPGSPPGSSASESEATRMLADFASEQVGPDWYVVNDNVMGGRSEGDFRLQHGELYFAGRTNTDGGGFSSIRTETIGVRYTWRLTTGARWRGREIGYWADFDTIDGAWVTVDIPFARFIPQFRGTRLDGPELDPGQITGMGLMIYDKLDGPFELRLASVQAY
jgi:hypothetical protein